MVYSWELKIFLLGEGLPGFLSQSPKEACLALRSVPQKSGSGFVVSLQGSLGLRLVPRVAWVEDQSPGLPGLEVRSQNCLGLRSVPRGSWVWVQPPELPGFEVSPWKRCASPHWSPSGFCCSRWGWRQQSKINYSRLNNRSPCWQNLTNEKPCSR